MMITFGEFIGYGAVALFILFFTLTFLEINRATKVTKNNDD